MAEPGTTPRDWARLLVCPACRGDLRPDEDGLACPACRVRYPIVAGVPHVIPERAVPLPDGA